MLKLIVYVNNKMVNVTSILIKKETYFLTLDFIWGSKNFPVEENSNFNKCVMVKIQILLPFCICKLI